MLHAAGAPAGRAPASNRVLASNTSTQRSLLVIARGREPNEPEGQMPWSLTPAELEAIATPTLVLESTEDFLDDEDPPVRRFRAVFRAQG